MKLYFANEFVGKVTSEQYGRLPEQIVGAKLKIRKELEELGKEGKLGWTSLNGGPFFDMCKFADYILNHTNLRITGRNLFHLDMGILKKVLGLMKGPAGIDIPNKRARIYGTGNNPLYWTPLPTMAFAAANMLRNPLPILNRPIYISTVANLTQSALLSAVESVLGTKFTVEHVDVEKINTNARIALDRGELAKAMNGLTVSNQFYEGDSGNDLSTLAENETVGVPNVSVEDAVRQAIEKWGVEGPIVETLFLVEACEI